MLASIISGEVKLQRGVTKERRVDILRTIQDEIYSSFCEWEEDLASIFARVQETQTSPNMQSEPAEYWSCMAAPRVRMLRCICSKIRGKTCAPPEDLSQLPRAEHTDLLIPEGTIAEEAESAVEANAQDSEE
eukprot:9822002-Karenia_brevis.AAC.1